jgi:hypothetical protein
VNDRFTVGMRFASGQDDNRSGNQTLGVDEDFDPDPFFIDRAYADIKLPQVGGLRSKVRAGKIGNPFVWSYGKDLLIVEKDVSLEGAALLASRPLSERTKLFFHAGGFVADENSTSKDPKLFVAQLGGTTELSDDVETGLRFSAWEWRSLDTDFIDRAADRGNLPSAFDDSRARIGEVAAFAKLTSSDAWPLILYGTYVQNFNADSDVIGGFPVDEEDTAWSAGFEIGSSSRWAKLGVGYFHIEANSVVAQFTDSDLMDGFTNRRGWLFYVSKMLAPGVVFKLELFDSDSIKNSPPFSTSGADGDRKRFRTDLVFTY